MKLIETTQDLKSLCEELQKQEFLTLDTEFVREKTYYSKLCLIQIGWTDDAAIVDPLAKELDLTPFFELLANPKVLKVLHSGRQDIEIFYNLTGKIPVSVFDTQIAAKVCGYGAYVSYADLVLSIAKVELDKSSRLTDWTLRPLEKQQLEYALRDVTFLIPCYLYLKSYLEENQRESWIKEEMAELLNEKYYKVNPNQAWRKIKHSAHSVKFLAVLKELAAWRERRAMNCDVPRKSIMRDETLLNIAAAAPKNADELLKVRNLSSQVAKSKLAPEIIEAVQKGLSLPDKADLKKIDNEKKSHSTGAMKALVEILRLFLKIRAVQSGVTEDVIASDDDLKDLACGRNSDTNPLLSGWRYELFGKDAVAFRKGKASISYDPLKRQIAIDIKEKSDEEN